MSEPQRTSVRAVIKTLLLTDLVNSTQMNQVLGDMRTAQFWADHDRMARDLLLGFNGQEVDRTDGFLLLFDRPVDAVAFALAYHSAIAELQRGLDFPIAARAGVHLGELTLRENPPEHIARGAKRLEVEGLAKPTAARIMDLAQGGQTLVTRAAFELARLGAIGDKRLPGAVAWIEHGHYTLKGVDGPVQVCEVALEGRVIGPPPASAKAFPLTASPTPAPDIRVKTGPPDVPPAGQALPRVQPFAERLAQRREVLLPADLDDAKRSRLFERVCEAWRAQREVAGECDAVLRPTGDAIDQGDRITLPHEPAAVFEHERLLDTPERLDIDSLLWLALAGLRGLGAAHGRRLLHGGLQTNVIYVDAAGRVKLGDFGIAPAFEAVSELGVRYLACVPPAGGDADVSGRWMLMDDEAQLATGWVAPFFAHELLTPPVRLSFQSDQFALGALLYLLATGVHPLGAALDDPQIAFYARLAADPIDTWRPEWKASFERKAKGFIEGADKPILLWDDVVQRLLHYSPGERFSSLAEPIERLTSATPALWREASAALEKSIAAGGSDRPRLLAELRRWSQMAGLPALWQREMQSSASRLEKAAGAKPAAAPKPAAAEKAAAPQPAAGQAERGAAPVVARSAQTVHVGIDLGTTFSMIAHLDSRGQPALFPDAHEAERFRTPSVVHISERGALVGQVVEELAIEQPDLPVIRFVKLRMGESGPIFVDHRERAWTAEGVSALILKKLKRDAKAFSGQNLGGVIITIPASFSDAQRRATLYAGHLAGLQVVDLIEEPVAAALHYGTTVARDASTVLVYDLGGGTFDATVMAVGPQGTRTLATEGGANLGGKEFDESVMALLAEQFRAQDGYDPLADPAAVGELRRVAEALKIKLSQPTRTEVTQSLVLGGRAGKVRLTREMLESSIKPFVDRSIEICERALTAAEMDWAKVDRIMMAGGSSLIPYVEQRVGQASGKPGGVLRHQPHMAVAYGAALIAARRGGEKPAAGVFERVTSHDLGLSVMDRATRKPRIETLIPRNTRFPVEKKRTFYSHRPDQRRIVLDLAQVRREGERPVNLGRFAFTLDNPRKNHPLEVTVAYDQRGLISVTACDPETGRQARQQFDDDSLGHLKRLELQLANLQDTPMPE